MLPKISLLISVITLSWIFAQSTILNFIQHVVTAGVSKSTVNIELLTEFNQIEGEVFTFSWKENHTQVALTVWESMNIEIMDGLTGERVKVLLPPLDSHIVANGIQSFDWSPDGQYLAATYNKSSGNVISIWNLADADSQAILIENPGNVPVMVWSPDSQILATVWGTENQRRLFFWDGATGELLHSQVIDKLAWIKWSPDGASYLTYQWEGGPLQLWDAATYEPIMAMPTMTGIEAGSPMQIAWSAGGEVLIGIRCPDQFSACGLWRWYLPTNKVTEFVPADEERFLFFSRLAWSPDGELLAVTDSVKPVVYFFDMVSGELVGEMTGHTDVVRSLDWSSDGETLATSDGVIRVWRISYK